MSTRPALAHRHADAYTAIRDAASRLKSAETVPDVETRLSALGELLHQLYASEEAPSGLLEDAKQTAPQHADAFDALSKEHTALLGELQELSDTVAAMTDGKTHNVGDRIGALVRRVLDHEKREATLIADTWYEELGEGD